MIKIHTDSNAKIRIPKAVKWMCLVSLGLLGTIILAVLALTLPDLIRPIPTPDVVRTIEMEQTEFNRNHRQAQKLAQDTLSTATAVRCAVDPVQPAEPFITDLPGLPPILLTNRQTFDDDFTSITRGISRLTLTQPHMTFEEASSAQRPLRDAVTNLNRKFNQAWIDMHGKEARRRGPASWSEDPSYKALHRKIFDLYNATEKLAYENLVRHEKWDTLAQVCEYDHWERWPEAVYYWRRHGGIDGYWHIAGGALYVHTRNLPIPDFFRKKLPYQAPLRLIGQ